MIEEMEKQRTPMMSTKNILFHQFWYMDKLFFAVYGVLICLGIIFITALQYTGLNQNGMITVCMVGAGILRLTEVEQRAKSNTNRLNEHDEILKSNSEMIGAIKELATEVKYMRGDLNETVERLNKLEGKDGDKWDKFKWLIVTGLVTLILGYLAVSVGLK